MNTTTNSNLTALQSAALSYIEDGFSIMPGFSPAMVAERERLESIRNSQHLAAHIFCHLLSRLCKQPLRPRFIISPISNRQRAEKIFGLYEKANLLISLGRNSDLLVLDVDSMTDSKHKFNTRSVVTRHGEHFYFRYPKDFVCSRRITAEGIHLQGDGMWVHAPPSEHGCGKYYVWVNRDLPLAMLPDELRHSRNAMICQKWLITALEIVRNTFYGLILFPALKTGAPLVQRMISEKAGNRR